MNTKVFLDQLLGTAQGAMRDTVLGQPGGGIVTALMREGANSPAFRGLVFADLKRTGYDLLDELVTLPTLILILHGRQDLLGEAAPAPLQIYGALPRSELVWLDELAHYS